MCFCKTLLYSTRQSLCVCVSVFLHDTSKPRSRSRREFENFLHLPQYKLSGPITQLWHKLGSSLVTRTRFTRFTFITSGGGYSKSVGYKRTFELVPVHLSGSFPTFIQYLQNHFFKSLAILQYCS